MVRNYRLDFMGKVGAYADALGGTKDAKRLPPEALKADVAHLSWRHTLVGLARIARSVAFDGGRSRRAESANRVLRDALLGLRDHPESRCRRIAEYVAREDVPIAT